MLAAVLLLVLRRRGWWRTVATPRTLGLLTLAAAFIAVNWGLYIWAVNFGHVVEAALGYYINPILSVLLGVLVLGERLVLGQWLALGLAGAAVVVLAVDYGHPPWVALILAASFATYGLLKKRIDSGALETLTVESAVLTPVALGYLIWLQATGALVFGHHGGGQALLLASSGLVTLIPLLLFAAAATRLPLSTVGLLQYITPPPSSCSVSSTSVRRCHRRAGSASVWSGLPWSCSPWPACAPLAAASRPRSSKPANPSEPPGVPETTTAREFGCSSGPN